LLLPIYGYMTHNIIGHADASIGLYVFLDVYIHICMFFFHSSLTVKQKWNRHTGSSCTAQYTYLHIYIGPSDPKANLTCRRNVSFILYYYTLLHIGVLYYIYKYIHIGVILYTYIYLYRYIIYIAGNGPPARKPAGRPRVMRRRRRVRQVYFTHGNYTHTGIEYVVMYLGNISSVFNCVF